MVILTPLCAQDSFICKTSCCLIGLWVSYFRYQQVSDTFLLPSNRTSVTRQDQALKDLMIGGVQHN